MRRKLFTLFSVVALLLVCGVGLLPWVWSWPRPAAAVFREWRSIAREDARRGIAEEIVRDGHLVGLTPEDVVRELGRPNDRRMSPEYGDLKYVVGNAILDDLWLCIHIEAGNVRKTEIRSDYTLQATNFLVDFARGPWVG